MVAAVITVSAPVVAQTPKGEGPRRDAAEKREEKREEKLAAKDAKRDGGADKERRDGGGALADVKAKVAELRAKHAATRDERRKAERAKMKEKWGGALVNPAVRAELAIHARREARLDAMEEVAKADDKDALVTRIQALRAKEEARHQKRMNQLAQRPDGGGK